MHTWCWKRPKPSASIAVAFAAVWRRRLLHLIVVGLELVSVIEAIEALPLPGGGATPVNSPLACKSAIDIGWGWLLLLFTASMLVCGVIITVAAAVAAALLFFRLAPLAVPLPLAARFALAGFASTLLPTDDVTTTGIAPGVLLIIWKGGTYECGLVDWFVVVVFQVCGSVVGCWCESLVTRWFCDITPLRPFADDEGRVVMPMLPLTKGRLLICVPARPVPGWRKIKRDILFY